MSKKEVVKYNVIRGEYKGTPTITLCEVFSDGSTNPYPFTFGKNKAKAILSALEEIKKFVEETK